MPRNRKNETSAGGAVGIEHDGRRYLVTAAHVVRRVSIFGPYTEPEIYAKNYRDAIGRCRIVAIEENYDLAILSTDDSNMIDTEMTVAGILRGTPSRGLRVFSAGYYLAMPIVRSHFILRHYSAMSIDNDMRENITTMTRKTARGFSGGPVFATDGTLIGILIATSVTEDEYSSFSSADNLLRVLERLR